MHLDFIASKNLLEKYGIDVEKTELARTQEEAKLAAEKVGFPCIMKIDSPVHKTEINAVIKNIENHTQAMNSFNQLKKLKVEFENVLVQKQLAGKEIFIGGKQDAQFGPVILFGLGGIFVEVLKDYSLKLAPVTKKEAQEMIKKIKGFPILGGIRGEKVVALEKIQDALVGVSNLLSEHPEIKELDLNPLIVSEHYCRAVDLRVLC